MTTPRDAEIDALQTLDTFIEKYGEQTMSAMHRALIELAARAMLGASAIKFYASDPASEDCPLCKAVARAARRAHEIGPAKHEDMH